jgi:hypothetical protein
MECDPGVQKKVVITNQDKAPVTIRFASGEVYEAPAARLDPRTGVYVPTTSAQCVPTAAGDMTLQYTQGDKCVHRRIPEARWTGAQMGDEAAFYYTVPSWNFGDRAEVCLAAQANGQADNGGNASWWGRFRPRSRAGGPSVWLLVALVVALVVALAVAAAYWRDAGAPDTTAVEPPCPAVDDLKRLLRNAP